MWARPEPTQVYLTRQKKLAKLAKATDREMVAVRQHYTEHPWDFIADWGQTFDPRLLERGLQPVQPFVLWPRQVEYLQWIQGQWQARERGLVEKSRDCGVTWLSAAYAATMWLFVPGFVARFGSRKEDLVDRAGDMDAIFPKAWFFLNSVPQLFRPRGFGSECRAHLRIVNPNNGAILLGEAGDNIGRGGRASIAFVDEAAFIEHQNAVDAALSQTTNCQIDISTPNGTGNPFYEKRMRLDGTSKVFIFDWRDDPRKDDAWYQKQCEELDEVIVAQEIDRDYEATNEDAFIPAKWVRSALDAHVKLGFDPEGIRTTGFDPADVGDARALVNRYGSVVTEAVEKRSGDITAALPWAHDHADQHRAEYLVYDGDGMGAPAMKVFLEGRARDRHKIIAFHGAGAVRDPGKPARRNHPDDKSNIDTYVNFRAQAWTWARERFEATHEAVTRAEQGLLVKADPEDLISIASTCDAAQQLIAELSRPRRIFSKNGKIQVEAKAKMKARGVTSPNLADALVIAFSESGPKPGAKKKLKTTAGRGPSGSSWMAS